MAERAVGIDISKYQNYFDIDDAKEEINFVFQRTSYGRMVDEKYEEINEGVVEFAQRGGAVGAYHYYSTAVPWQEQADLFLDLVRGRGFKRFALDYEGAYNNLNEQTAIDAGKWVNYVSNMLGSQVGIYCRPYHYRDYLSPFVSWHHNTWLWIARWPGGTVSVHEDNPDLTLQDKLFRPDGSWTIWQYVVSDEGDRYGTQHKYNKVDLDVFNGTVAEMEKWFGMDEPGPEPEPEPGFTEEDLKAVRLDELQRAQGRIQERIEVVEQLA